MTSAKENTAHATARRLSVITHALGIGAFLILATLGIGSAAVAQSQLEEDVSDQFKVMEATFLDWDVTCGFVGGLEDGEADRICEMRQLVLLDEAEKPFVTAAIQMQADGSDAVLSFIVPFGLSVSDPLPLNVAHMLIGELSFHTCLPRGCIAIGTVDQSKIADMALGDMAEVTLTMLDGEMLLVPLSLRGFEQAWNSLQAEDVPATETTENVANAREAAEAAASAVLAISEVTTDFDSAAPAMPLAVTPLDKPFTQIGLFRVEANARNARDKLQREGLPVEIRPGETDGRPFWRVRVGPARDAEQNKAFLVQVRALGFNDAYHVRN